MQHDATYHMVHFPGEIKGQSSPFTFVNRNKTECSLWSIRQIDVEFSHSSSKSQLLDTSMPHFGTNSHTVSYWLVEISPCYIPHGLCVCMLLALSPLLLMSSSFKFPISMSPTCSLSLLKGEANNSHTWLKRSTNIIPLRPVKSWNLTHQCGCVLLVSPVSICIHLDQWWSAGDASPTKDRSSMLARPRSWISSAPGSRNHR